MLDLFDEPTVTLPQGLVLPKENGYHIEPIEFNAVKGHKITIPHGELLYFPQFFSTQIADRALGFLLETANGTTPSTWDNSDICWQHIPWRQDSMMMFGKEVALPRLSSWHGDSDRPYTYSKITLQPLPWNKALDYIRDQLQLLTNERFNSVLLNLYRTGDDHISWHTDAEPELGTNPQIASVNVGASRRFLLRPQNKAQQSSHKVELLLSHGSVLIMQGATQHYWQHSVPKQAKIKEPRINLTFRHIIL